MQRKCAWNTKCMWKHVQKGYSKRASSLTTALRSQPFTARDSEPALSACDAFAFNPVCLRFFPTNPLQKWPPHVELPLDLQAHDPLCVHAWPRPPSSTHPSLPSVCPWQSAPRTYSSAEFSIIFSRNSSTFWEIQTGNRRKQLDSMNSPTHNPSWNHQSLQLLSKI